MKGSILLDILHFIIFLGLTISGTLIALAGLLDNYAPLIIYGGYLAGFCSISSLFLYITSLSLSIYNNKVRQFWGSCAPLNFGLTMLGIVLTFININSNITLTWLIGIGVSIAFVFHRWRLVASLSALVIFHLVVITAPPIFGRHSGIVLIPLATTLVMVPIILNSYPSFTKFEDTR